MKTDKINAHNLCKIAENINMSPDFNGKIFFNEPMKAHTTFKVGGPADFFIKPFDTDSFVFAFEKISLVCHNSDEISLLILGGGSNLVVRDGGIRGFVLSTEGLQKIELFPLENDPDKMILVAGSGCTFKSLIDYCVEKELSGLECFAGLPGTVGGAVYMNARCYDNSISNVLYQVQYVQQGKLCIYSKNESDWDYKKSPFQRKKIDQLTEEEPVIVAASFVVTKNTGKKEEINCACQHYISDRKAKGHFKYPSAGSVFKNNHSFGQPSGKLIDDAGLKGYRVGNAEVAPWHGNFIINLGDATADDVETLVSLIIDKVEKKTGFRLECEVLFCGCPN